MYLLNFGKFCLALENAVPCPIWKPYLDSGMEGKESAPASQRDVVTAVLLLPYSDKVLEDADEKIPDISDTYASRCVHNISREYSAT